MAAHDLILVADNEQDICRLLQLSLELEGFDVAVATDGAQAYEEILKRHPALVLLDVVMPHMDGIEVCRRLRADGRTSHIPIILLSALTQSTDKLAGFGAGADDYVSKPFDPAEVVARVHTLLRRAGDLRAVSPLTGLPGNHRIHVEVARRLVAHEPLAVVYADLNEFKAYNDHYGFLRGDEVLVMTADVLGGVLAESDPDRSFLGHIGGDDFMLLCHPAVVERVCAEVITDFDGRIKTFYDAEDLQRGHLQVVDRQGHLHRAPIVSIALGVASTAQRAFRDHRAMIEVASEMKLFAKLQRKGSGWAVDERAE